MNVVTSLMDHHATGTAVIFVVLVASYVVIESVGAADRQAKAIVALLSHNRVVSTYRSPARLWWEWRLNVRFLSDWLALQCLPWWWVVGFYDTCAELRHDIIEESNKARPPRPGTNRRRDGQTRKG